MKLLRRINQQNPNLNPLQATSGSSNNEKDDDSGQGPMWFYVCLFVFLVLSSIFMFAATRNRAEEVNLSDREQIKKIITEKLIKENVLNNENAFYIIREEDGKQFLVPAKVRSTVVLNCQNSISIDLSNGRNRFSENPEQEFNFSSYKYRLELSKKTDLVKQEQQHTVKQLSKDDFHIMLHSCNENDQRYPDDTDDQIVDEDLENSNSQNVKSRQRLYSEQVHMSMDRSAEYLTQITENYMKEDGQEKFLFKIDEEVYQSYPSTPIQEGLKLSSNLQLESQLPGTYECIPYLSLEELKPALEDSNFEHQCFDQEI